MSSERYYLEKNTTLEVIWTSRLLKMLDAYQIRCAIPEGIIPADYTDPNLEEAESGMEASMSQIHQFIISLKKKTGILPIVGDRMLCAPNGGAEVRIAERIFYTPTDEPDILGVVYRIDTDEYDYLMELGEENEKQA